MRIKLTLAAAAALLAGCGGGSSSNEAPPPPSAAGDMVPSSATASVQAYVRYAGSLPASDTAQPLRMDNVVAAPTSDDAEPLAI